MLKAIFLSFNYLTILIRQLQSIIELIILKKEKKSKNE